jgi:glutamate carboxypeptidase
VTFVLDPDEEVGSPASRGPVAELARGSDAVLVLEAARETGAVVTSRKGITNAYLRFEGRAAHAGVEPERGRNALLEAAHATIAIQALNGRWDGTTFNVGVASGGTRTNVVPEHAEIAVDVRSVTESALAAAEEELRSLAETSIVPDVMTSLELVREHRPMERSAGTAALFERARAIAAELGFDLQEAATGGASDANVTAALGVPTLDGLGPVGGDDHSAAEWILRSSVLPRAAMLGALIASAPAADPDGR